MVVPAHSAENMKLVGLTDFYLVPKNRFGAEAVVDVWLGVKFEAVSPKKAGIVF